METPETRYARSGDVSIAYQIVGEGPFDVVYVPGAISNVELIWDDPHRGPFFGRLASFCRLIVFDKRGTGASDRISGAPSLETRMDDVRAVMDAAGSERAAVVGVSEGGPMSILFAATYPDRAPALVLYGTFPKDVWAPDFPWAEKREDIERELADEERRWGTVELARDLLRSQDPALAEDGEAVRSHARRQRLSASPGALSALARMNMEIDVRHVLPAIRVPTLVLHRTDDHIDIRGARWMADRIPGARFVELPGGPHMPYIGDSEAIVAEIEAFVSGIWESGGWAGAESDRVLATVLFTDIVGSTQRAVELGDARWRDLVNDHHSLVRAHLARFRGREMDTAGDGFFATFDGPARAIRCACAITEGMRELELEVRAGLHTGECELIGDKAGGIAVNIGARVASEAGPGEVLVSSTVKDLVAGSGIRFADRGSAELKGVPGEWRLYAVQPG